MTIDCTTFASPLGRMWLAAEGDALAGAWFDGQRHFAGPAAGWRIVARHPLLDEARGQLEAYFAGRLQRFALPLASRGTPFQRLVWDAIAAVPFGRTVCYAELAATAGAPRASRAAGAATGRNPWTIVVPCHRIVGAGGALTGYAGGLARKRALLALEGEGPRSARSDRYLLAGRLPCTPST
jgi:methylated-DNA-[protein]-cysteine S-methyltransferase